MQKNRIKSKSKNLLNKEIKDKEVIITDEYDLISENENSIETVSEKENIFKNKNKR